jgi:hypothetical protein
MAFKVVLCDGRLGGALHRFPELQDSAGLQFVDSVLSLYPGCDILLTTHVNINVFNALSEEFTTCATQFGCVSTKKIITDWETRTPNVCRFNMNNTVTMTFGVYESLYSLEKDMPVLQSKPCYSQHFICLILKRSLNWRAMVNICCSVLQIQLPVYKASQCASSPDIVLMGWQKTVSLLWSEGVLCPAMKLIPTMYHNRWHQIKTFNTSPVYLYRSSSIVHIPRPIRVPNIIKTTPISISTSTFEVIKGIIERPGLLVSKSTLFTLHTSSNSSLSPLSPIYTSINSSLPPLSPIYTSINSSLPPLSPIYTSIYSSSPPSPLHLVLPPSPVDSPSITIPPVRASSSPIPSSPPSPLDENMEDWVLTAVCIEE